MKSRAPDGSGPPRRELALRLAAFGILLLFVMAWVETISTSPSVAGVLDRDWAGFYRAGQTVLEGPAVDAYASTRDSTLPFAHPPFVLYACALIGWMPPLAAYVSILTLDIVALELTVYILCMSLPAPRGTLLTTSLVTFATMPALTALVVGQVSPLWVLIGATGVALSRQGRSTRAGLVLGLLFAKPNLAIALWGCLLLLQRWRIACGMIATAMALCVSTLPLGLETWPAWLANLGRVASALRSGRIPMWKQQSLFATVYTAVAPLLGPDAVMWVWGSIVLMVLIVVAWHTGLGVRTGQSAAVSPGIGWVRGTAALVLVICLVNPYLFFYDGLLLVIPGILWWLEGARAERPGVNRGIGVVIGLIFTWQHLSAWFLKGSAPPITGLLTLAWLLLLVCWYGKPALVAASSTNAEESM